jgi:hypothetical protein
MRKYYRQLVGASGLQTAAPPASSAKPHALAPAE